jgi:hypothetical protein
LKQNIFLGNYFYYILGKKNSERPMTRYYSLYIRHNSVFFALESIGIFSCTNIFYEYKLNHPWFPGRFKKLTFQITIIFWVYGGALHPRATIPLHCFPHSSLASHDDLSYLSPNELSHCLMTGEAQSSGSGGVLSRATPLCQNLVYNTTSCWPRARTSFCSASLRVSGATFQKHRKSV